MAVSKVTAPQNEESSTFYKLYATVDANKDLTTEYPGYNATQNGPARAARAFMVLGASGNLVVRPIWGADAGSNDITLPLAANVLYPITAKALVSSGSTVTNLLVLW